MVRRKMIAVGALAATSTLAFGGLPAAAVEDPSSLILHYDFDVQNVDGATIHDLSGRGIDGTLVNPSNAQIADGALTLSGPVDGSNAAASYVAVENGLFDGVQQTTINARVWWDGGEAWQWIYTLGADDGHKLSLTPNFSGRNELESLLKPDSTSGNEVYIPGAGVLPSGRWIDLTTVVDADSMTFYIGGVNVGVLDTTLDFGSLHSANAAQSGWLGRSFWENQAYFGGKIDDFRVYDVAFDDSQVAELVGGELPTPTSVHDSQVTTFAGVAPELPTKVVAQMTDGIDRPLRITWDEIPASAYAAPGEFTVTGHVGGISVSAAVTVIESRLTVDLGQETGDFHGGASGTLYGVYGEGVPSQNLLDGMKLRTVSTKPQDGIQHPGGDGLEVAKHLADSSDGITFLYMPDYFRNFPYQIPPALEEGQAPQDVWDARWANFKEATLHQVDLIMSMDQSYWDNIVLIPFNEPEGNTHSGGDTSLGANPFEDLFAEKGLYSDWKEIYQLIKDRSDGHVKVAGLNSSGFYDWNRLFLERAAQDGVVPDWFTWHELDRPDSIRKNVATFRSWETAAFAGTPYEGTQLPINLNEYANNYHTGVPGQIIQWVAAVEDSKVDGNLAYWNMAGNLSDSAVQSNRGNGQWWLLNRYAAMSGSKTVKVTPPQPGVSYTLQGVASLDAANSVARVLVGGQAGDTVIDFDSIPESFGSTVHALVTEIPYTGQLGDSAQPEVLGEFALDAAGGSIEIPFGNGALPELKEESAYEIVLTPGGNGGTGTARTTLWQGTYEAEDAQIIGNRDVLGPEGSPENTYGTFTSGRYALRGFVTGADLTAKFTVEAPEAGEYELDVYGNTLNTSQSIADRGATNVYLSVNEAAEQELELPIGYKWVVWSPTKTTVTLQQGVNTIAISTRGANGRTVGDGLLDRIDVRKANPAAQNIYEAEHAVLTGARTVFTDTAGDTGSGGAEVAVDQSVTFWAHAAAEGESALTLDTAGGGRLDVDVNGVRSFSGVTGLDKASVYLKGGLNKIVVTGAAGTTMVDRLLVTYGGDALAKSTYEAEDAIVAGDASIADYSHASGGKAVTAVGGEPGNGNTLRFENVTVEHDGTYALTIRYSNEEQDLATHYNPHTLARHAELSINGGEPQRIWFPTSFHENSFWELSVPIELTAGVNTLEFSSEELTMYDGVSYASELHPDMLLRSKWAPNIDRIAVTQYAQASESGPSVATTTASRCVAGKAFLAVSVRNDATVPVDLSIATAYGAKSVAGVQPGKTSTVGFNSRQAAIPAGAVSVTASAAGMPSTEQRVEYDPRGCR